MTEGNPPDSPLEAAAGGADPRAAEAFELLANETRLAILLALWDAYEPFVSSSGVTFSELRDRVGRPDSGQFNYHIGKLKGQLIRSTEEGYTLRPAGEKIIRAVIAGSGLETPTLEPTELPMSCPRCGAATSLTYRGGRVFQVCTECGGHIGETDDIPEGTLYTWRLEPAGLTNRNPTEVYRAASIGMIHRAVALIDGVCPECTGTVDTTLKICEHHEPGNDDVCPNCGRQDEVLALYQCTVCKFSGGAAPSDLVSQHPAVIAFYYDHGVDFQYDLDFREVKRVLELEAAHQQTLESVDPVRIRVTIQYEGDELTLLLDEAMSVLEVH
jgi:DNA-binding transcriptional ArsR family regulator